MFGYGIFPYVFWGTNELKPHKSAYDLNAGIEDQEVFEQQVKKVCQTYLDAEKNEFNGIHTVSTDEKTGIQALERVAPNKPMEPGKPARIEFEYARHGTTCLFGNKNVATGDIVAPKLHPTRTEEDFADNIDAVVSTDPEAGWIFVLDNLNTHMSATLVLLVALLCDIPLESLGEKGKSGVLKDKASRRAFLEDESHRIRFVYTPKHCSWLNQIEVWFGGLSRRVLRRGSFASIDALNATILVYVDFYNLTAKPTDWKYDGTPQKQPNAGNAIYSNCKRVQTQELILRRKWINWYDLAAKKIPPVLQRGGMPPHTKISDVHCTPFSSAEQEIFQTHS